MDDIAKPSIDQHIVRNRTKVKDKKTRKQQGYIYNFLYIKTGDDGGGDEQKKNDELRISRKRNEKRRTMQGKGKMGKIDYSYMAWKVDGTSALHGKKRVRRLY